MSFVTDIFTEEELVSIAWTLLHVSKVLDCPVQICYMFSWWSTGTGCPERLWVLLLWRYSRPAWTGSCAACCRWPCFGRGIGLDDPLWSLPTPKILWLILWFCDSELLGFFPSSLFSNHACKRHQTQHPMCQELRSIIVGWERELDIYPGGPDNSSHTRAHCILPDVPPLLMYHKGQVLYQGPYSNLLELPQLNKVLRLSWATVNRPHVHSWVGSSTKQNLKSQ